MSNNELTELLENLPPREVAIAQAKEANEKYKAHTVATSIRLSREQIEAAKRISSKKGLKYQLFNFRGYACAGVLKADLQG